MPRKKPPAPSPWGDGDLMAVAAFRYCCGRQTYIVGMCADWLIREWPNIADNAKAVIQRDLEWEFKHDDDAREEGREFKRLGSDCDRKDWERVRMLWATDNAEVWGGAPTGAASHTTAGL